MQLSVPPPKTAEFVPLSHAFPPGSNNLNDLKGVTIYGHLIRRFGLCSMDFLVVRLIISLPFSASKARLAVRLSTGPHAIILTEALAQSKLGYEYQERQRATGDREIDRGGFNIIGSRAQRAAGSLCAAEVRFSTPSPLDAAMHAVSINKNAGHPQARASRPP